MRTSSSSASTTLACLTLAALLLLGQPPSVRAADSIECSSWGPSQCNRPGVPDKCPGMCSGRGSSGSGGAGPGIVIINDGRAIATGGHWDWWSWRQWWHWSPQPAGQWGRGGCRRRWLIHSDWQRHIHWWPGQWQGIGGAGGNGGV
ncbi:hypothetical protein V8C86DRAFT_2919725, partial [Haematococcus lacustris]